MQIPKWKGTGEDAVLRSRFKSVWIGENFLFFLVYIGLAGLYVGMFCIVIYNKKDSKIGAGVLGSNGMSDFAFGIGLVSQIMSVFFVLGWMFMSYHCRAQVIGRYHVHPKTNILCELMFILTHICLIVSDRTFVSMLPQQIDFTTVVYPLSVAMTVLLGIMTIYLVVKLFSKFICKDEPAVAQENK